MDERECYGVFPEENVIQVYLSNFSSREMLEVFRELAFYQ